MSDRHAAAMDRAAFLRRGAAAALAAGAGGLVAAPGSQAAAPVRPSGEDIGFLQWGATAELVSIAFYDRALRASTGWGAQAFTRAERTRLKLTRASDAGHLRRLRYTLAGDAPKRDDFTIVLPDAPFNSRRGVLELGARLERLIAGVYLDGVTNATDPGTRALLGRLLASESQHISALEVLAGAPATTGLLAPVYPEAAGAALDAYVRPGASAPRP